LNEPLRRALLRSRLREEDVAAHLGVDPKTVRRWLNGRIPYPANRAKLADLVGAAEADLWPEAGGPLTARTRPAELVAIYPDRSSVPRDVWRSFFASAQREIGILTHSASFLAKDRAILRILTDRARAGVNVRIALRDPDSPLIAEPGKKGFADDAMPAVIRNALVFFCPLAASENIAIRLHQIVLYNSIYQADDQLMVNQHSYGVAGAHSPVFSVRGEGGDMFTEYLASFERIWSAGADLL
jgi:transcriptional regulator with XRE-family HTH domain